jgi:outer membrane protein OmpA-like peptidoglycan-associated protein
MIRKTVSILALSLLTIVLPLVSTVFAMELSVLRFGETRTVKFKMFPTRRVPGAEMKGEVKFEEGQSRIKLQYKDMKPAVLFGGEITCYVLWAVNRDGVTYNLGELWVRPGEEDDELEFSTGLRNYALLVTAEPYYQVMRPSELVLFWNDSKADPPVTADPLQFDAFTPAPETVMEDLGSVQYDGDKPLDLLQAERVYEAAEALDASSYSPDLFNQANIALQQATHMFERSREAGAQRYARRSVAASNDAISLTLRKIEIEQLEAQIAQRQSEMAELENRAAKAESRASEAEQQIVQMMSEKQQAAEQNLARASQELAALQNEKTDLETVMSSLRREQEELRSSMQELQQEKTSLQGRLQAALSEVADTRESARGFVVNLPDILFDVGKATLQEEAKYALAKLAGILLIMQDLNLRIEGHTDSTGSPSFNLRLSERRADAVFDFLAGQGIETIRMKTAGYGMDRPIADNTTAAGRSQNRRVEIVIAEGEIKEDA